MNMWRKSRNQSAPSYSDKKELGLVTREKKNACEFIIHRAISKGEMARSLLGIYLR